MALASGRFERRVFVEPLVGCEFDALVVRFDRLVRERLEDLSERAEDVLEVCADSCFNVGVLVGPAVELLVIERVEGVDDLRERNTIGIGENRLLARAIKLSSLFAFLVRVRVVLAHRSVGIVVFVFVLGVVIRHIYRP